jgi:beta-phosphoglucomutase-like phosphatase (HAD superfamily)
MIRTQIDGALADAALLELDPMHRLRTAEQQQQACTDLLAAWYAQEDVINLWDFTRQVLNDAWPKGKPTPVAVAKYILALRHIMAIKARVMVVESEAYGMHQALRAAGATIEEIAEYEALAMGDR